MNIHRITYNPKEESCSLYFIGCNFRCTACYWKQIYGRVDFKKLRFLALDETIEILRPVSPKRVCIISGEPRACDEFNRLPKALFDVFGCEVRLMTNGYLLPSIEGLGHASVSLKAFSEEVHKRYTGRSNRTTFENFRYIHQKGIDLSASSVLIPDHIGKDEIVKIAQFIASVDTNIPYRIIGYMPVDGLSFRRPSCEELEEAADAAGKYLRKVVFSSPQEHDYTGIRDLFTNHLRK
jgi:pyruvate formate lyase activating enzyme